MKFETIRCALAFCHNDIERTPPKKKYTPKLDVQHDKHILILRPRFYFLSFALSRFILQMWHLHIHTAYGLRTFNSIHLHIYTYIDSINRIRISISRVSRGVQNRMSAKKKTRGQNTIYILHLLFFFFYFFRMFCFAFVLIFNLFFFFF